MSKSPKRYAHFGRPKSQLHKSRIAAGVRAYQARVRKALAATDNTKE